MKNKLDIKKEKKGESFLQIKNDEIKVAPIPSSG
jgi:hypothetical protein